MPVGPRWICPGDKAYHRLIVEADQADIFGILQTFFLDGQHGADRHPVADGKDGIGRCFGWKQVQRGIVGILLVEIAMDDQLGSALIRCFFRAAR
jgi:hypothetical protein